VVRDLPRRRLFGHPLSGSFLRELAPVSSHSRTVIAGRDARNTRGTTCGSSDRRLLASMSQTARPRSATSCRRFTSWVWSWSCARAGGANASAPSPPAPPFGAPNKASRCLKSGEALRVSPPSALVLSCNLRFRNREGARTGRAFGSTVRGSAPRRPPGRSPGAAAGAPQDQASPVPSAQTSAPPATPGGRELEASLVRRGAEGPASAGRSARHFRRPRGGLLCVHPPVRREAEGHHRPGGPDSDVAAIDAVRG